MVTRVVGIGQQIAGDDGVGLAVLAELRRRPLPNAAELVWIADPMDLVGLFDRPGDLVLVDAVLATPPGRVLELAPADLSGAAAQPASSHGLGAARAIELATALSPRAPPRRVRIVAVTIARPDRYRIGLSPDVAAAVPVAAARVLSLLEVDHA